MFRHTARVARNTKRAAMSCGFGVSVLLTGYVGVCGTAVPFSFAQRV